jgi:signal transduction histidine kinase
MPEKVGADLTVEGLIHDLNNVFQTLLEAADLLETDRKWSPLAASMRRSVERGRRILSAFSEDSVASTDLEGIIAGAIEFAGDVLRALHIPDIEFCRRIEAGIRLKGAPMAWERALFNLFINAGQAMRHGGVIEIWARRAGQQIEITVADSGSGIPLEILPQIFKPHFSTRTSGSGLGLHIVESIVRQNGGSVHAANRTGAPGAAFRITVPA